MKDGQQDYDLTALMEKFLKVEIVLRLEKYFMKL